MTNRRKVIVHIAASADGYIARPDGDLEWLTSRPAPEGFYGMNAFMKSIDTLLLGRKTYEVSLSLGGKFDSKTRTIVFSHHAAPPDAPAGVEFVNSAIDPIVSGLREQPGKDIWLMGGGELIASFLDEQAIDEFVHQRDPGVHWGWHSTNRAASPPHAYGFAVGRALRRWSGSTALSRSEPSPDYAASGISGNSLPRRTNSELKNSARSWEVVDDVTSGRIRKSCRHQPSIERVDQIEVKAERCHGSG